MQAKFGEAGLPLPHIGAQSGEAFDGTLQQFAMKRGGRRRQTTQPHQFVDHLVEGGPSIDGAGIVVEGRHKLALYLARSRKP
ncbi:MAG: hypothetical protein QM775_03100 [Pirellulales bacterium]